MRFKNLRVLDLSYNLISAVPDTLPLACPNLDILMLSVCRRKQPMPFSF
jgi:hypothetical protein